MENITVKLNKNYCFVPNNVQLLIGWVLSSFFFDVEGEEHSKSKLEMLAEQRDYKRRRQSYRAKNVHITKRSPTDVSLHLKQSLTVLILLVCVAARLSCGRKWFCVITNNPCSRPCTVARFYIIDSDCLTVSYILTILLIGSLTCASPPLLRFQCFDFAREFDGSILPAVVHIVCSRMNVSECNLCLKKNWQTLWKIPCGRQREFDVLSETLTLLYDVPKSSEFICIRQS